MKKIEIEKATNIHTEEWSLTVGTSAENPNYIELRNSDKRSIDWFGTVNLAFTKEEAKQIGLALISAAEQNNND